MGGKDPRQAFTLVELLVVIFVIGLLVALLMPAVNVARESARRAACQSNLRQFGVGMQAHADRHGGLLSSGAFDWAEDGAVTEFGWVSDMVDLGILPGEMKCPTNPAQVSEAYNDLLSQSQAWANDACYPNRIGSVAYTAEDGSTIRNPCRGLFEPAVLSGEDRRLHVEENIYELGYDTNFTASWYFARGGVLLQDSSGEITTKDGGCPGGLESRNSTLGPLTTAYLDSSRSPSSLTPVLGDGGGTSATLSQNVGENPAGTPVVSSITGGPRKRSDGATMAAGDLAGVTGREGTTGWLAKWNTLTVQDYTQFAPVHGGGTCNILFADGSVRNFRDVNEDELMNSGFSVSAANFKDDTLDLEPNEVVSHWSLRERRR